MSRHLFIHKLRREPLAQWFCLAEALFCLACARFAVRFVPPRLWRRWIAPHAGQAGPAAVTALQRERAIGVARCVRRVAAHVPFHAPCLPQALAARWMLSARGIATHLQIGARPALSPGREGRPIDLHAWLLLGDLCLTGGGARAEFNRFRPSAEPDVP